MRRNHVTTSTWNRVNWLTQPVWLRRELHIPFVWSILDDVESQKQMWIWSARLNSEEGDVTLRNAGTYVAHHSVSHSRRWVCSTSFCVAFQKMGIFIVTVVRTKNLGKNIFIYSALDEIYLLLMWFSGLSPFPLYSVLQTSANRPSDHLTCIYMLKKYSSFFGFLFPNNCNLSN